jgi:preprotein translocase subunit SecY
MDDVLADQGFIDQLEAANQTLTHEIALKQCGTGAKIAYKFRFLGTFDRGDQGTTPKSGLAYWISSINILDIVTRGGWRNIFIVRALAHILFYMVFSTMFAVFWVKTSGMDASSQAKNIMGSGLQIPGFRKDERVLESVLSRYIMPLTIMGGAAIGLLASAANLLGAIVSGTAILLAVMIMYQFYQNIAQQHAVDMHPALKKMMG